jgi:hypothetical protein
MPVKWLVTARLGLDPDRLRPVACLERLRSERTLVITGDRDVWAGPDDLSALAAGLPGCSTHLVPGAQHHDVWVVGGDAYVNHVRAFLEARLR